MLMFLVSIQLAKLIEDASAWNMEDPRPRWPELAGSCGGQFVLLEAVGYLFPLGGEPQLSPVIAAPQPKASR
jgi:hypothetical protein